ncbi:MAG: 50S ribosomal protein L6 [Candidatus Hodarchaeales archaeon]
MSYIYEKYVPIPEGIDIVISNHQDVKVKGPKGEIHRSFEKNSCRIERVDDNIVVYDYFVKKKQKGMTGTIAGHIKNMINGVQNGYVYHLKIIFSHFPIEVSYDKKGNNFIIKGLYGYKGVKKIPVPEGVKVEIDSEDVRIKGIDIEKVSQTAARIQEICRLRGKRKKDDKKFQDGIYIYKKE